MARMCVRIEKGVDDDGCRLRFRCLSVEVLSSGEFCIERGSDGTPFPLFPLPWSFAPTYTCCRSTPLPSPEGSASVKNMICDFISSDIHRLYAVNHDLKDSPFSNESLSGIGVEDPVHRGTVQSTPVFGRFLSRVKGLSSDRLRRRRGGMWRYRI